MFYTLTLYLVTCFVPLSFSLCFASGMPSVNYEGFGADDWREVKNLDITNGYSIYVLPPIRYPDGKFLMYLENGKCF